ncbi:MAG: SDR family oxidoreductase [Clostridiales Family XIII bacterium]|nr:SDR family oxidoreductase [Clostridiales Family XIII bacterium]
MLRGKNIIITGTNRGIGKAALTAAAKNGANIWAHARQETAEQKELISALASEHGVEIWPIWLEVTDKEGMKEAVKEIRGGKRPVDALINNAGITYNALFQMSSEENLREQFEVNFFAVYLFTQLISKLMARGGGGSIVSIASSAGIDGNPGKTVYGASKAAVITMSKSISRELGPAGVRANCIAPGITETDMLSSMPKEVVDGQRAAVDLRRAGDPAEIADAAIFLASDYSSFITGQVLRVDGGMR